MTFSKDSRQNREAWLLKAAQHADNGSCSIARNSAGNQRSTNDSTIDSYYLILFRIQIVKGSLQNFVR